MLHYDKYIVAFSGGKDSTACFLHLLEIGIPIDKIELWHHDVDGRGQQFMDWECTESYCKAFAAHFKVPIYFSWKQGGFMREMLRNNSRTAPISFETPDGVKTVGGIAGKQSTRLKFPQVSADLKVRWCSAYLKIDVMAAAIRNQPRFNGIKTVVLSGERGEESKARSNYAILEADRSDNRNGASKRYVDRLRPIRDWAESEVWSIIERYKVRVHPAYYLGYGRVSCKWCIFGNKNQFATSYSISPEQGENIIALEKEFGYTIKNGTDLRTLIEAGEPYEESYNNLLVRLAIGKDYDKSIICEYWTLPAGAYGECCGPV